MRTCYITPPRRRGRLQHPQQTRRVGTSSGQQNTHLKKEKLLQTFIITA